MNAVLEEGTKNKAVCFVVVVKSHVIVIPQVLLENVGM